MSQMANFVWSIADQLREMYKPNQRITNERLSAQSASLTALIAEPSRSSTILEADLVASRQAHAEAVASLLPDADAPVTTLASRR